MFSRRTSFVEFGKSPNTPNDVWRLNKLYLCIQKLQPNAFPHEKTRPCKPASRYWNNHFCPRSRVCSEAKYPLLQRLSKTVGRVYQRTLRVGCLLPGKHQRLSNGSLVPRWWTEGRSKRDSLFIEEQGNLRCRGQLSPVPQSQNGQLY